MPLLPINEEGDVLNCTLHWRKMQNASYDSSLFKINCGCHCNDLLLNLPMKRSKAVTISSSAPCFSLEMGKVVTSSQRAARHAVSSTYFYCYTVKFSGSSICYWQIYFGFIYS